MSQFVAVTNAATLVKTPGPGENVIIINNGPATIYVSNNSAVTTTTGLPLTQGSRTELFSPFNVIGTGAGVGIYGITASGTANVTVNGTVS